MRKIWKQVNGTWVVIRYGCPTCEKTYKTLMPAEKHIIKCRINSIKRIEREQLKEQKNMPVKVVMKDGKRYYRWGESGKLYEKREDAAKQGRAAYASGYTGKYTPKNK